MNPLSSVPAPAPGLPPRSTLRLLCVLVRGLVVIGVLATLIVPLWFWASPDEIARSPLARNGMPDVGVTIDARVQWLGLAAALPMMGIVLFALWQLWVLFGLYAAGQALTDGAQRALRRFAWAVLIGAIATPVHRALLSVILTVGNVPGQRVLAFTISGDDYMQVLLGIVLLAIAIAMTEAVGAAEENRGFV